MEHKVIVLRNTGLDTKGFQEFSRMLQLASLEGVQGVERPDLLLYEQYQGRLPTEGQVNQIAPAVVHVGPWPTKAGVIGNAIWHVDKEHFQHVNPAKVEAYTTDPMSSVPILFCEAHWGWVENKQAHSGAS